MDNETRLRLSLDMLKEVIERDMDIPLKTSGLSMRPAINDGDWIVVRRAREGEIQAGDIIIYQADSTFVAHRVINRREAAGKTIFQVKGDAHLASEGVLPAEKIVARVVTIQKRNLVIDMEQPFWRHASRIIACYSSLVDILTRRLHFQSDPTGPAGRLLTALVCLPPRLVMALFGLAATFSRSENKIP